MDECEPPDDEGAVPDHPRSQEGTTRRPAPTGESFSAFYRRFVPTLVAFLMWQGARLPDGAELAQATMSEAYRSWSTIREPEAWARCVASRKLAGHIARVKKEDPTDTFPERGALLWSLTNVTAWEQQHEVLRLLDLLPSRQRQVMAWTLEGYTPAEIAKELDIDSGAVRSSLSKARKALAQHLDATGEDR